MLQNSLKIPAENIFPNRLLFDGTSKDLAIRTFIYACFTQMTIGMKCYLSKMSVLQIYVIFLPLGHFAGFDEKEPTSESGGKTRVVKHLKTKFGYKK